MTFRIDDKQLDEMIERYKNRMNETRFFNLASRIGADSAGYSSSRNGQKQEVIKSIESFFGVYGLIKRFASSYGPGDFSENFAFYCGSVYGDSLLEKHVNEVLSVSKIGLNNIRKHQSEALMVNNILASYVTIVSRISNGDLPKLTRGFFQGIASEAEQELKRYTQSLEEISKEEIIVGDVKLKGVYFSGKGAVLEGSGGKEEAKTIEPVLASQLGISFEDIGGNYDAKKLLKKLLRRLIILKSAHFMAGKRAKELYYTVHLAQERQCLQKLLQAQ